MTVKALPIDVKWARKLAQHLLPLPVSHLHIIMARLAVGAIGALGLLLGSQSANVFSTLLLVLFFLFDHVQKEYAVIEDCSTEFEDQVNFIGNLVFWPLLFFCVGMGQILSPFGLGILLVGIVVGVFAVLTELLLHALQKDGEKKGEKSLLPSLLGYDLEDLLYLIPFVAVLDIIDLFLLAAFVCLPLGFALLLLLAYRRGVWFP